MQLQRTDRRRPTRRRRSSSAASPKTHPSMRWRLTSASSARWRKLWCSWTSRPNVIAGSALLASPTVSSQRVSQFAVRSTSITSTALLEDVVDRICEIHFHTIKNKKVECKKAQPKETVTPATQLQLQKRLLLSGLGIRMPTGMVAAPGGGGVMPTQLGAYNPAFQAQVSWKEFPLPRRFLLKKGYGFQAQASMAGMMPNQMQAASGASAVTGGKLFATYPPSFHALRWVIDWWCRSSRL